MRLLYWRPLNLSLGPELHRPWRQPPAETGMCPA
jgi:hypothetical protein